MFYCDGCRVENGWPGVITTSFGKCEVCDKVEPCYDFHHRLLTDKKPVQTDEDWQNLFKDIT